MDGPIAYPGLYQYARIFATGFLEHKPLAPANLAKRVFTTPEGFKDAVNPDGQEKYVYKCGASTDGYIDSLDTAVCGKFSGHFSRPPTAPISTPGASTVTQPTLGSVIRWGNLELPAITLLVPRESLAGQERAAQTRAVGWRMSAAR
jgi:hypothetical protein